jgi:hypothetical protein
VNRKRPLEIKETITMSDSLFFSSPKQMANAKMKITQVDFVIVYREIVMNSKDQLENPMSREEAQPATASFFHDVEKGMQDRDFPERNLHQRRTSPAIIYLMIMWKNTIVRGKWNPLINHF